MPEAKKKILFIAHHFPPLGGPGVHRAVNFARYLAEQGYELHVITVSIEDIEKGTYPADYSLLDSLLEDHPDSIKIHRVPIHYPEKFKNFLIKLRIFRLFWFFLYPLYWEPSAFWPYYCKKLAKKIIKEEKIDLVWSTAGPFVGAQLGAMLKRSCDVKWVLDLRDPFTEGYHITWPSKFHWLLSRWMEKRVFGRADKIVVVGYEFRNLYIRRKLAPPEKITVITNGYGD